MTSRRSGRAFAALGGLLLFLVSIRMLGAATGAATPFLHRWIPQLMSGQAAALGVGWMATYLLVNGSVVAALAVSLCAAGVLTGGETYLVISGSRLSAAAFVVLVGLVHHRRSPAGQSVREALELGLLTFLVTHSVYLPAAILGGSGAWGLGERLAGPLGSAAALVPSVAVVRPVVVRLVEAVGALPVFLAAVWALFVAIRTVDRAARSMDQQRLRERYLARLDDPWLSFASGLVLTLATASIAFSVGIAVPLYNRGLLTRKELIPYVLGANLGTLADTLVVGLVLGTAVGTAAVATLLLVATTVTALLLIRYRSYAGLIDRLLELLIRDRRSFALFAASLVLVPALLVLLPLL